MKINLFLICWLLAVTAGRAQDIKDLYYAPPEGAGLYLGLLYLNDSATVLCGTEEMYLLNHEKLFVDTLHFAEKTSFEEHPMTFTAIDHNTFTFASLAKTMIVQVRNNQFHIQKEIILDRQFKKANGNYLMYILFPEGLLVRPKKSKDKKWQYYFAPHSDKHYDFTYSGNLIPPSEEKTSYKGSEVFGFSRIQYLNGHIYIYLRKENLLICYSPARNKVVSYNLPPLEKKNQLHEIYLDPIQEKIYMFQLTEGSPYKLYLIDPDKASYTLVKETTYIVRGVFNGQMYVSGTFDGVYGHYLIPVSGQNEEIIMLNEEY